MADCCTTILNDLESIENQADGYVIPDAPTFPIPANIETAYNFLFDIALQPPNFIEAPFSDTLLPTLAEMLRRIATPLDSGFGEWQWYNYRQPGKTALTLPQAPTPAKTRVCLNNVELVSPRDYSIVGATLTFVVPLAVHDLVWVKSYGN